MIKAIKIFGIIFLTVVILSAGVLGGIYLYNTKIHIIKDKDYNYLFGKITNNIVDTAQYIPDANKLFSYADFDDSVDISQRTAGYLSESEEEVIIEESYPDNSLEFTEEGFSSMCDLIGGLSDYSSGKYLGYSIYELKDEMLFLTDKTPVFDQWFVMDDDVGLVDGDMEYTRGWRYYISYNEETERLSITRFSSKTRAAVYISDEDVIREENVDFFFDGNGKAKMIEKSFKPDTYQFQVMTMDYYYDNNDEVVECSVYDVMNYADDYYPIRYEYLKNIKDKSITRYQIVVRDRLGTKTFMGNSSTDKYGMPNGNGPYSTDGFDIDTDKPCGIERNFVQIDYVDKNDISILKIDQMEGNDFITYPNTTGIILYVKTPEDTVYYNSVHSYYDKTNSKAKEGEVSFFRNYVGREYDYQNSIESYFFEAFNRFQPMAMFFARGADHGYGCQEIKTIYTCDHFATSDHVTQKIKESCVISSNENIQNEIPYYINKGITTLAGCLNATGDTLDEINSLPSSFAYDGSDYGYENSLDKAIYSLTENILEDNTLRDGFQELEKRSNRAAELTLNKDNMVDIFLDDVIESDGIYGNSADADIVNGVMQCRLYTSVNLSNIMEKKEKFSIDFVLYSANKDYVKLVSEAYTGIYDGSNRMKIAVDLTCDVPGINISRAGKYKLGLVITTSRYGEKKIISEILPIDVFNSDIYTSPTRTENGFILSKTYSDVSTEFYIILKKKDIEAPVIESIGETVTVAAGSTYQEVFDQITFTDNDKIDKKYLIAADNTVYTFSDTAESGTYTLVVTDFGMNRTSAEITIIIE